jgi:hypothetical protein
MMALFRSYPANVRLDYPEIDGLMRVLDERIADARESGADALCFEGARIAFHILRHFDRAEYPVDFMALFEKYMKEGGF